MQQSRASREETIIFLCECVVCFNIPGICQDAYSKDTVPKSCLWEGAVVTVTIDVVWDWSSLSQQRPHAGSISILSGLPYLSSE